MAHANVSLGQASTAGLATLRPALHRISIVTLGSTINTARPSRDTHAPSIHAQQRTPLGAPHFPASDAVAGQHGHAEYPVVGHAVSRDHVHPAGSGHLCHRRTANRLAVLCSQCLHVPVAWRALRRLGTAQATAHRAGRAGADLAAEPAGHPHRAPVDSAHRAGPGRRPGPHLVPRCRTGSVQRRDRTKDDCPHHLGAIGRHHHPANARGLADVDVGLACGVCVPQRGGRSAAAGLCAQPT